jgi:glucan 1,3-beta-glucosidase
MDALQNYFFWTWKIGDSTGPIAKVNPFWNYQLGLENGWITPGRIISLTCLPNTGANHIGTDPRNSTGICAADGVSVDLFSGTYSSPYMTGGSGAGQIAATDSSSYPWPPASFTNIAANEMTSLPQYTQTGNPVTMPAATYTSPGSKSSATINAGNGWFKAEVNQAAYAAISG